MAQAPGGGCEPLPPKSWRSSGAVTCCLVAPAAFVGAALRPLSARVRVSIGRNRAFNEIKELARGRTMSGDRAGQG
jgi:hypothetical protein